MPTTVGYQHHHCPLTRNATLGLAAPTHANDVHFTDGFLGSSPRRSMPRHARRDHDGQLGPNDASRFSTHPQPPRLNSDMPKRPFKVFFFFFPFFLLN
jgi:hypothetical protein